MENKVCETGAVIRRQLALAVTSSLTWYVTFQIKLDSEFPPISPHWRYSTTTPTSCRVNHSCFNRLGEGTAAKTESNSYAAHAVPSRQPTVSICLDGMCEAIALRDNTMNSEPWFKIRRFQNAYLRSSLAIVISCPFPTWALSHLSSSGGEVSRDELLPFRSHDWWHSFGNDHPETCVVSPAVLRWPSIPDSVIAGRIITTEWLISFQESYNRTALPHTTFHILQFWRSPAAMTLLRDATNEKLMRNAQISGMWHLQSLPQL